MKPFAEAETNPYAPPETGPVETNRFHSSFQIFGEGILCRSGLVLPVPYPANDIVRLSLFGGVVLFVLVIHPVLTRTIFAGTSLHAHSVDEHQVEVTGFSSDLPEKLSLYADGKNRPVKETPAALRNS